MLTTYLARQLTPGRYLAVAFALALPGFARSAAAQEEPASPIGVLSDTTGIGRLLEWIRATNPDLIARRRALAAATARLAAAGFGPASVLTTEIEGVPDGIDVGAGTIRLALEHEFLTGGRRAAARAVASAEVEAGSAELYAAERRVTLLATEALARAADWLAIARRLADQDSLLRSAQASLQTHFAAGGARYVDVLRLRTERLRVEAERAKVMTEGRLARQALLALAGPPDSAAPGVTGLIDSLILAQLAAPQPRRPLPAAPDVDSLLAASGARRAAEAGVTRARAARRLALANRRPRLAGILGAQRFAGEGGDHAVGPVIGFSMSLPFTAHRANRAAAAAAEREVEAATAQRDAALAGLWADLFGARERYEAVRARLAVYDAALLRGAREEREGALAAYRSGSLALIELLDFERALARAEIDRLRSQIEAATALTDLVLGGTGGAPSRPPLGSAATVSADAP